MKTDEHYLELMAVLKDQHVETQQSLLEMRTAMAELKVTKGDFEQWKPLVETNLVDLQKIITDLHVQVEQLHPVPGSDGKSAAETSRVRASEAEAMKSIGAPATAHLGASSPEAVFGPIGHRSAPNHRGYGFGVHATLTPPPVTGASNSHGYTSIPLHLRDSVAPSAMSMSSSLLAAMPQLNFP